MTEKATRAFHAWLRLSITEQAEFDKAVSDYKAATGSKKTELNEANEKQYRDIVKVQTGPLSGGCPYCGR